MIHSLQGRFCLLLVLSLFSPNGFAEENSIAISLDPERVRAGRVLDEEIEGALSQEANAWTALARMSQRKAVFALFKTLKFHSGRHADFKDGFFVLSYEGITYCVSWPAAREEDPCRSKR
jgi:hypothetical protein